MVAFHEASAQPIPNHLFLFGHWTFDDDLVRLHIDDDVVGWHGLRPSDPKRSTARKFLLPFVLVLNRRFQQFVALLFVGTFGLGQKLGEQLL